MGRGGVGRAGGTKGTISIYITIKQDYKKCNTTGINNELWTLEFRYH